MSLPVVSPLVSYLPINSYIPISTLTSFESELILGFAQLLYNLFLISIIVLFLDILDKM